MEAKITNVCGNLQLLGFTDKTDYELSRDIKFADKRNGIYNKNIDAKQLFLFYDILSYEEADDTISVSVDIELHQMICEFDIEGGLKYVFDVEKEPLAYFTFDIDEVGGVAYINGEWNQEAEDMLRELAVAKVIEVENLIWNKIKEQ